MCDIVIGLLILYGMGLFVMCWGYGEEVFRFDATKQEKIRAARYSLLAPLWPFVFIVGVTRIVKEVIKTALEDEDGSK